MSKVDSAIEQIRTEANKLHQRLDEATAKNEDAIRKANEEAADKAKQLASKLRTLTQEHQREDAARLANAASSLEAAAASAKKAVDAKQAELHERNQDTLHHVRAAVQNVTHTIASTAKSKQPV